MRKVTKMEKTDLSKKIKSFYKKLPKDLQKRYDFFIDQKNGYKEKFLNILPFLVASKNKEELFFEFLLQFPPTEEGEKSILNYFFQTNFMFDDFNEYYGSDIINTVLNILGDINEDGGSHSYKGIYYWSQVRQTIEIYLKDEKDFSNFEEILRSKEMELPRKYSGLEILDKNLSPDIISFFYDKIDYDLQERFNFFIDPGNGLKEQFLKVLPFLMAEENKEEKFFDFLLQFPSTEEGEKAILQYFFHEDFMFFYFEEFYLNCDIICFVLNILGDINVGGESKEFAGVRYWWQIRDTIEIYMKGEKSLSNAKKILKTKSINT